MERRWPLGAIVVGMALLTFFLGLGTPQLFDEDEPKNAECGREMFARGDWLVPTFNEDLRTDKPILVYWFMLTAYHMFGVTEFAARFWSAALGVGTCLLTYNIGRILFSPKVGAWAGVMLASTLMFTTISRASTPDSTLIFFTTLSLFLFVRLGYLKPKVAGETPTENWRDLLPRKTAAFLAIYAAMAGAVLAKGPVGVLLPCLVIVFFLYATSVNQREPLEIGNADVSSSRWSRFGSLLKRWFQPGDFFRITWAMRPYWILLCVAAIALPWYVAVGIKTHGAWLEGFLGQHNVGRFLKPMEGHHGPVLYYPIAILLGFFPWSVFCLPVIRGVMQRLRRESAEYKGLLFVVGWFTVYLVFFTCARTKLPNYILPCYPAIALLTAWWFERAGEEGFFRFVSRDFTWAAWSFVFVGLAMIVGLSIVSTMLLPGETFLAGLGLVPLLGGILVWRIVKNHGIPAARIAFAGVAGIFILMVFVWAAPRISRHQDGAFLAEQIRHRQDATAPVATYSYFPPGLVFYAQRQINHCRKPSDLPEFFSHENALLITRADRLKDLKPQLPEGTKVLARRRRFLRRHDIVVIGRPEAQSPPIASRPNSRSRQ